MRENLRYILTLSIICLVMASLLTGIYLLTNPKILEQRTKAEQEALEEVMPEAGYFEPVKKDGEISYFRAYSSVDKTPPLKELGGSIPVDKRKILGYAFRTEAQGYSSLIETMAGMDTKGKITGIKILAQNETPGLGAKVSEVKTKKTLWQAIKEFFSSEKEIPELPSQPWFCAQFKNKKIEDLVVVKGATEKNIQAITGATISSEALTNSVREKAKEILSYE
ncbi:MAG: FMN-binding protein [Candidatus Omnitrophica bacterium]|nr:FMN-binding protein [Candidatus Omnitrophota bacterium]